MNHSALAIIERALSSLAITEAEAVSASEALGELRRRDWAVRVLDAYAVSGGTDVPAPVLDSDRTWCVRWLLVVGDWTENRWVTGHPTPDAARLAAALAVFPMLPDAVRAELGECP